MQTLTATAELTREQVRQKIDTLECVEDLIRCIDDVSGVEFEANEPGTLKLQVAAQGSDVAVAFAYGIPPSVLLAGLQAMRAALEGELQ